MEKILEFLRGANGDLSSKRLGGIICLIQGCLMKAVFLVVSCFWVPKVGFDKIDSSIEFLFYVGGSLLGAGLLEFLNKKKK